MPNSSRGILIVEDDPQLRHLLAIGFAKAGFSVRLAADGRQALAEMRATPAAAVVIDLILPDADAMETIMEIKRHRPLAPVVAITGGGLFDTCDLLTVARAVGADGAMAKPLHVRDLVALVSRLLAPPRAELAA